ncbi:HAMP domain-containing methyl-accepting chemotaxis protein [Synechocystis salina]|uniref:HAMP domain-containing protein n=1 Tax=Synechocystis salina LEGE 00031 TaxID=1828736 RepID=A0ABR9VNM0_9SYNC|nr:HAMP domain-containing methyl-accepting chemotaxis protein [Synechocystis salina]MBE9239632.1 HAMP domain-containing protein [Synechocystis salina LEGE 00041]MBE9252671.1 HAMP domain-containing protein [Synechocystis salina LEGE 00031]
MASSTTTPKFSAEILELEKIALGAPDDLFANIVLAGALQEEEFWQEAAHYYQKARALDSDGIYAETISKALAEIGPHLPEEEEEEIRPQVLTEEEKKQAYPPEILALQETVRDRPDDLVAQISFASALEAGGFLPDALAAYEDLKIRDEEGIFHTTCDQAIAGIEAQLADPKRVTQATGWTGTLKYAAATDDLALDEERSNLTLQKRWANLPIAAKQFTAFVASSALTVVGVVGTGMAIALVTGRAQLANQTMAELVISENNYNVSVQGNIVDFGDRSRSVVRETLEILNGGYNAIYTINPAGNLELSVSALETEDAQGNARIADSVPLENLTLVEQARSGGTEMVAGRGDIRGVPFTIAVKPISDGQGEVTAFLVRGKQEQALMDLLETTFLLQMGVGGLALVVAAIVAYWLGRTLTKPLKTLQTTAQKLGEGDTSMRAVVESKDEVGELARTFNAMAEQIEASTQSLQETSLERQREAENQRRQKEELQEGVVRLLTDIEESSRGDLTVRSSVEAGAVGAIADAFNATLAGLRKLVKQVVDTATEVSGQAQEDSEEITSLSDNALEQARALESATASVAEMAQSIESVAKSAQTAAAIAKQGNEAAQQGQNTMDQTVDSIYKVRGRVAEISKKSKRLAESSLEISKIVGIIAGISEKTNLLAFNASIEAARAGENGQGFRIVADEVRRLAEMVTLSAQEIEQVILSIQEETSQMSQLMEESTNEVVTGTQLVQKTKETLQNLTQISEEIDGLLDSISRNTESQRLASQTVTETVQNVASVAKSTSDKSQQVSQSLQSLAKTAVDLQTAAGKFKVE